MELEELRSIWKSDAPGFKPMGESEIAPMLKGRSMSIVDKLKRSVRFELILTLAASVGLLIYALTLPSGALKWSSLSIILMCIAYTVYYVKKLILLSRFDPGKENIRANLEALIHNLSVYLRYYKRSYTTLYPIYFLLGLLFAAIERGATQFMEHVLKPATMFYLLLMASLVYFLSTRFTDWYLKKLYGNHLNKLQGLLDDLSA
jgi:hypothetical protein